MCRLGLWITFLVGAVHGCGVALAARSSGSPEQTSDCGMPPIRLNGLLHPLRPKLRIPMRNGRAHFSSNNPGPGAEGPKPANPVTGRQNNQGFEGLAVTPGGKFLVAAW
jgi:hypothetical protein